MDLCDHAPSYIRSIAPYQPGKPISELARELELDESSIIKLASNENPLGVSPRAAAAIAKAIAELSRYPDGSGYDLKQALGAKLGVTADRIVLGNGSNDVLEMVARAFLSPATNAVYAQHAFAVYPLATQATGARGIEVAAREFGHDLDAMLRAVDRDTRVMFIANPNNPTGTFVEPGAMHAFLRQVPANVVVVVDEAYQEYLPAELQADSIGWLRQFPNLVITRTFSKIYGLAGLRLGYALAHEAVADLMNRVRQPFNANSIALAAAQAALDDEAFVRRSREVNFTGMAALAAGFKRLELPYIPSVGNFVTVRVGDGAEIFRRLLRRGVIVRPIAGYGLPAHLRVTIGTEAENARLLQALEESLHD
ncbi:MAG: histidinol-phosphate transaminase [Betaproteobacteria bacterium]|nr:histidinol-phosphate transaminase [Betaproteobacteria bacterium]